MIPSKMYHGETIRGTNDYVAAISGGVVVNSEYGNANSSSRGRHHQHQKATVVQQQQHQNEETMKQPKQQQPQHTSMMAVQEMKHDDKDSNRNADSCSNGSCCSSCEVLSDGPISIDDNEPICFSSSIEDDEICSKQETETQAQSMIEQQHDVRLNEKKSSSSVTATIKLVQEEENNHPSIRTCRNADFHDEQNQYHNYAAAGPEKITVSEKFNTALLINEQQSNRYFHPTALPVVEHNDQITAYPDDDDHHKQQQQQYQFLEYENVNDVKNDLEYENVNDVKNDLEYENVNDIKNDLEYEDANDIMKNKKVGGKIVKIKNNNKWKIQLPSFELKEIVVGRLLGRGGYSNVEEIRALLLSKEKNKNIGGAENDISTTTAATTTTTTVHHQQRNSNNSSNYDDFDSGGREESSFFFETAPPATATTMNQQQPQDLPEQEEQKQPQESQLKQLKHQQKKQRQFMSDHCLRKDSGEIRYAIKSLKQSVMKNKDLRKVELGIKDLVIEAKFLSTLQHPNIIKLRAISSTFIDDDNDYDENDSKEGGETKTAEATNVIYRKNMNKHYFLILDRLYDTLQCRMRKWNKQKQKLNTFVSRLIMFPGLRVERKRALLDQRLEAAYELCAAVKYLHNSKILHRDIKPENIGFDIRGDIKIFDFGLARELHDCDRAGKKKSNDDSSDYSLYHLTRMTGTLRYMAPEVALGKPYNTSCDIYSLCVVFYEMFSLRRAYDHINDANEFMNRVIHHHERPAKVQLQELQQSQSHHHSSMSLLQGAAAALRLHGSSNHSCLDNSYHSRVSINSNYTTSNNNGNNNNYRRLFGGIRPKLIMSIVRGWDCQPHCRSTAHELQESILDEIVVLRNGEDITELQNPTRFTARRSTNQSDRMTPQLRCLSDSLLMTAAGAASDSSKEI